MERGKSGVGLVLSVPSPASNPWKNISTHPFALFPHVTKDCDSGKCNAMAVGSPGPASVALWETVRPAARI